MKRGLPFDIFGENADSAKRDERDQELQASFPSSSSTAHNNQLQSITYACSPTTNTTSIPTDSDGFAENPNAYKPWKQKPVKGEVVTPQQFRERLAAMVQGMSMGR